LIKSIFLGVNFINILRTNFLYERLFGSFFYVHVTREKLPKQHLDKKFLIKMLMKLAIGWNVGGKLRKRGLRNHWLAFGQHSRGKNTLKINLKQFYISLTSNPI